MNICQPCTFNNSSAKPKVQGQGFLPKKIKNKLSQKTFISLGIVLLLIVFGVASRFLPHAPNFTPLVAIALFSACYLPKKWGLVVPLAAMFVADLFIGFYDWPVMAAVYSSFVLIGVIGWLIKKNKKWFTIGIGAIGGALLFFFITNFAVWAFTPWYAKTFTGLIQSFTLALPFFKNTLFSSLLYSASLFGAYELALFYLKARFTQSVILSEAERSEKSRNSAI